MYGSRSQAVRVKVKVSFLGDKSISSIIDIFIFFPWKIWNFFFWIKKNEKNAQDEWRKFSVDPQITSLEVLYSILAKAFDIKGDFGISYATVNPNTKLLEQLIIFSDWDLDAAFLR
jgi:hypothetical protein